MLTLVLALGALSAVVLLLIGAALALQIYVDFGSIRRERSIRKERGEL